MKSTLATLALGLAAGAAQAGTFDAWTLNGSAQLLEGGNTLRLAEGNYQAGTAWAPGKLSLLHDFSIAFSFQIAGGTGADGITLTFQDYYAGAASLGSNGQGLGYEGIERSIAVVYDTWDNGYDTDRLAGPNTAFTRNGSLSPWEGQAVGHNHELRDKVLYSWVDYSAVGNTFNMYISDTNVKPLTPQESLYTFASQVIGFHEVYVGFTGATGGASDNHDILGVSITSPIPEADAAWLALGGLPLALALSRRRRRVA